MARQKTTTMIAEHEPLSDEALRELWEEFRRTAAQSLRNQLMEHYMPLVRLNAERMHAKLPEEVELDDLISAGTFGLMNAIDHFDLERGVKFETYCSPRIRGAILDELRYMDWVPRLVRSRSSKVNHAQRRLEMRLGRKPTEEEIAEALGVDPQEYDKIRKDAGAVQTVSLSRKWFETDSNKDVREIDVLEDQRQQDPALAVHRRDVKELITRSMSRSEQMIIVLYYYEQMTMKEIGMTLDLSESRVSQMHSSILARLKAQLQNRDGELRSDP